MLYAHYAPNLHALRARVPRLGVLRGMARGAVRCGTGESSYLCLLWDALSNLWFRAGILLPLSSIIMTTRRGPSDERRQRWAEIDYVER